MENLNLERKSLNEIIDDAHSKGIKVVIIGEPIVGEHHRAMINMDEIMVINSNNLLEKDQEEIAPFLEQQKPTMIIKPLPKLEDLPLPVIIEDKINGSKPSFKTDSRKINYPNINHCANKPNNKGHYRRKH